MTKAPAQRAKRAAAKPSATPKVEAAPVEAAPARRLHRVDRELDLDGKRYELDGEVLPALTAEQFAQLKAVGAVEGEWEDGAVAE